MLDHCSLFGLYPGRTAPPHCVTVFPSHSRGIGPHRNRVQHVARHGRGGASGGDARARLSGKSTQKLYLAKWNSSLAEREAQSKEAWLQYNPDNPNQVLYELMEFMACRCFEHNNQQSAVRGYLAAIHFFHNMYAGWELPTSHYIKVAVGKGIDRAHGMSQKKALVRLPLTWAFLSHGKQEVSSMVDGGHVMWLGLALSNFLLSRLSCGRTWTERFTPNSA